MEWIINGFIYWLDFSIKFILIIMSLFLLFIWVYFALKFSLLDLFFFVNIKPFNFMFSLNENIPDNFIYSSEFKHAFYNKLRELEQAAKVAVAQYKLVLSNPASSDLDKAVAKLHSETAQLNYISLKFSTDIERSSALFKSRLDWGDRFTITPNKLNVLNDSQLLQLIEELTPFGKYQSSQQNNVKVVTDTLDYAIKKFGPFNKPYLNFMLPSSEFYTHVLFFKLLAEVNSINPSFNDLIYIPLPQATYSVKLLTFENVNDFTKIQTIHQFSDNYRFSKDWKLLNDETVWFGQSNYPDALIIDSKGKIISFQIKSPKNPDLISDFCLLSNKINYSNTTDIVLYSTKESINNINIFKLFLSNEDWADVYKANNFSQFLVNNSSIYEPVLDNNKLLALQKEVLKSIWVLGNNSVIIDELLKGEVVLLQYNDSYNFVGIKKNELTFFIDNIKLINSHEFNNLTLCKYSIEEQLELLKHLDIKMFKSFEDLNNFNYLGNFENNVNFNKQLFSNSLDISNVSKLDQIFIKWKDKE